MLYTLLSKDNAEDVRQMQRPKAYGRGHAQRIGLGNDGSWAWLTYKEAVAYKKKYNLSHVVYGLLTTVENTYQLPNENYLHIIDDCDLVIPAS